MRENKTLAALAALGLVIGLSSMGRTHLVPSSAAAREIRTTASPRAEDAGLGEEARALRDGETIDVNRASAEELRLLPRIGPTLAERIVAHRAAEGPFERIEELSEVRGVGPATVERLRDLVTIQR